MVYLVLAGGAPCDAIEPLDCAVVEEDLDRHCPGWRSGERGMTVDLCATHLDVSLAAGERGGAALTAIQALAARLGLELFDPGAAPISPAEDREAARTLRAHDAEATQERVRVWQREAESGDAAAMNELGNAYSMGEGVPEDAALAAQWYARARRALARAGGRARRATPKGSCASPSCIGPATGCRAIPPAPGPCWSVLSRETGWSPRSCSRR